MSDQNIPESGKEGANAELPTPTFESPSSASSTSGLDADALVEKVVSRLLPEIDRKIQSTKDKRIAGLEKKLGVTDLSELEDLGVSIPKDVQYEYRLRQLESQKSAPVQESSQGRGENPDGAQALQVINELELDPKSPETAALMSGKYKDINHFKAEAALLKVRQLKSPNPSPAQAPVVDSDRQPSPDLMANYRKQLTEIAMTKKGEEKLRAIAALKVEAKQKGLDVN